MTIELEVKDSALLVIPCKHWVMRSNLIRMWMNLAF